MWFRLLVVLLFIGMLAPVSTMAQQRDRHAVSETRSQVEQQSRREAGAMKRAGWKVMPNKMSLERQVRNVCFMEVEVLEQSGEKRYLIGSSSASDGSYLQARGKADLSAREKMVRQLVALILGESTGSNDLQDSTHSSDRAVNYKEIGPEYLQLAVPVLECYRMGRDGLYEVMLSSKQIMRDRCKLLKRFCKGSKYNQSVYKWGANLRANRTRDVQQPRDECNDQTINLNKRHDSVWESLHRMGFEWMF